ncbi:MAG TPA: N-acetyltransferase [bacterium]|nr:N-acetyltransferase [bacterium]
MLLRPELPPDIPAIRAVHEAAFPSPAEAGLVDALRAAGHLTISLVALRAAQVIGHVAFSPLSLPGGLGLAPVAVLPAWQRQGIGHQLITAGLAACRAQGTGFVVVLGEPSYYRRFGFTPAARWGLTDAYGGGEAFQALELIPGAIPRSAGLVQYAPAFATLSTND